LRTTLSDFHQQPVRVKSDDELRAAVLSLYDGKSAEEIWRDHVRPFVRENDDALETVYREHDADPDFELLDSAETLLVLERLEHDRARLRAVWPLAEDDLERLRDIWGVPV
jgi:hypothetical protein